MQALMRFFNAMSQPAAPAGVDSRVEREKIDLLMRGFKLAILSTLTGPLLVAWLFEPFIGVWQSWGMAGVIYLLHSERWFFFRRFNRARPQNEFEPQPWMRGVAVRLGVMGTVLGLWTLAATASGSETAMFYALTLSAILSAGALTQFCIYPPVVIAFVTPFLLGSTAQMIWLSLSQGGKMGWVSAVYLGVLWAVLVVASRRFGRVMHSDLMQRYHNEALLAEVQAQKDLAEAASEAKSRFLAAASHDLRQPVHAVALLADALQQQSSDAQQRALLSRLQGGVAHFADVVDEVLDVARLDAGAVPVNWQAVPVQELLDRVDATYRELAQAKGLALLIRPCADPQAAVRADPALLWRVLSNLVSNAVRYTTQGTVLLAVRRDTSLGKPGWRFEVRDSGPGIAPEHQQLIFEEFYQLHNPQRDAKSGLGLGLAVAHRMAKMLETRIAVRSKLEQGAIFSIALSGDFIRARAQKASKNSAKKTDLSRLAVLVVDDDEASREALDALLQSWGIQAWIAADVQQARSQMVRMREHSSAFKSLVVLTDHWLAKGEDAFAVASAVHSAAVPELALHMAVFTGDIRPELREQVLARGWFFAPKPVRPLALRMWLESLVTSDQEGVA
jgi:two-component system, sensor histidine kinase